MEKIKILKRIKLRFHGWRFLGFLGLAALYAALLTAASFRSELSPLCVGAGMVLGLAMTIDYWGIGDEQNGKGK